ncbi:MAG TPA: molybdopterin-dependent oxidoreductase [Vicinamibacterales bacterium]|nr:molybdopterin-dependent oxidoreductase [Vicinamibacterales bacterium]
MPGLGTTLGRGGATTAQQDLINADAILILGSSMAEAHPVGFRWVVKAREQGTTVIHVDPRFTRTSAMADIWLPLRAGSDIVFLGGLINYVLGNGLEFREYVAAYTNASVLIDERYQGPEDLAGFFSGWDPETRTYDPATWAYEGSGVREFGGSGVRASGSEVRAEKARGGHTREQGDAESGGEPMRDPTLTHPRCVFQHLKRHFARYTPEMVERSCGIPAQDFLDVAARYTSASGHERTATICYAVGLTQHSTGVQIVRAAAILQLLLGNIGRPGGGILALRGHASIQGSTDIPTLYDILPGYIPMPVFGDDSVSLETFVARYRTRRGWWAYLDRYLVSLLKAWYGDRATRDNDFGFGWIPRLTGNHSYMGYWLEMADGGLEGLFVMGQNPAVGGPNAALERRAMGTLKWMVVRDLVLTETAAFWEDQPESETEVFFFPAAGHAEKDGCFTNTQRLLQWHEKAVEAPGDARSEAWFMHALAKRLRARAAAEPTPANAALNALDWHYSEDARGEPAIEEVLAEINGTGPEGRHLTGFSELAADGSTRCGCWIYAGVFPSPDRNRARERDAAGTYGHGWGWAWPADRRILYNRASARPDGRPWSDRKALVWWDAAASEWTGADTPDFNRTKPPGYVPPAGAEGDAGIGGAHPFVMHDDGLGWLWVPSGLKDGPLPAHYEPLESPVANAVYRQETNPAARTLEREGNEYAAQSDSRYPHVLTTYRLTEHHTAGGMSRTLSRLAELQPELFCEMSPELAGAHGIANGSFVRIITPRSAIRARALVTDRMRPLTIDGRVVHQVGLPYHWGGRGLVTGDVVNDLIPMSEEPNVRIMESKALVCRVEPE